MIGGRRALVHSKGGVGGVFRVKARAFVSAACADISNPPGAWVFRAKAGAAPQKTPGSAFAIVLLPGKGEAHGQERPIASPDSCFDAENLLPRFHDPQAMRNIPLFSRDL